MRWVTACPYRILPPCWLRGMAAVTSRLCVASFWLHWLAVHPATCSIFSPSHTDGLYLIHRGIPTVHLPRQHTWLHRLHCFSCFSISAFQSLKFTVASIHEVSDTPGGTPGRPAPTPTPATPGEHLHRFS